MGRKIIHEIPWDKEILTNFIKYGNLTDEQREIMKLRTSNHTDIEIAEIMHFGTTTYYKRVEELKRIYDNVVNENPELNMPQRKYLNSKLFAFYTRENALDFINHVDWENEKLEIKIIRKKNNG